MPLSLNEIRTRALDFAREFRDARSEQADAQSFWRDFFNVFGIAARRVGAFEKPVQDLLTRSQRGRIDFLWKGTVLVEHKSRGEDLDAAGRQARDYFPGLKDSELPRFILVSDFARIRLHDLETGAETELALRDLPQRIDLFGFLSGYTTRRYGTLNPVDREAAERLGTLHDLLEDDNFTGHDLDVWMVRTLFCLFADSAGIFERGIFRALIETRSGEDGSDLANWLSRVSAVLATPLERRQKSLDESLAAFPYVNGKLFDARVATFETNSAMRDALLDCCKVDWSRVSPAIFGSLFQSIKDRAARRAGGEHYTSEANILKCLDPLFLDALRAALTAAGRNRRLLEDLLRRLRRVRVFDPACGCGNFLVVAYRELRRIELEVLKRLYGGGEAGEVAALSTSVVNVDQMFGIEVEDWPAQIAQVALWLTDHQMNMELSAEFGQLRMRLPLVTAPSIRLGNALREDWAAFVRPGADVYCVGNPPFVGGRLMSADQRADVNLVFSSLRNSGQLDYVACWYRRATEWLAQDERSEACFVSTNSITQGEQPGILWGDLWPRGAIINFAHRTFRWTSEARGKAAVHCVIIGFALRNRTPKWLFDYQHPEAPPQAMQVGQINPYLVDGPMLCLSDRSSPLSPVAARLAIGNQPIDNGQYLFTEAERDAFLAAEPAAAGLFRPWIGAVEFINGDCRWCLWLGEAKPEEIRAMPLVRERVGAVRAFRRASKRPQTRAIADMPTRFFIENIPRRRYLAIPEVSSENRRFIPMAFEAPRVLASNLLKIAPDADCFHFGVLTSTMHMTWVRAVCGRLKSDFRYSSGIVYNNFPWPDPTPAQRAAIEATAHGILDARAAHPGATLADLYDPLAMPPALTAAHAANDRAVDAAYAPPRGGFPTEAARLAFLFARYQALAAPLDATPPRRPARRRATA